MVADLPYHCFSGVSISSSIDLPELPRTSSPPEISFQFEQGPAPPVSEHDRIHDWLTPDGEIALSCFTNGSRYHLRFSNRTDFTIAADGSSIRGYATGNHAIEAVRHDLLAQVLPRVLSHRGRLVLHASAVSTPHGVVAFLGNTGTGKSTIAASFSRLGLPAIADDCLVLDSPGPDLAGKGPRVAPTLRGPRLWPDSATELIDREHLSSLPSEPGGKVSLPADADVGHDLPDSLPLEAAFVLHPSPSGGSLVSPVLTELSPAEALMSTIEHSFQLDITDKSSQERRLKLFSRVAKNLPTYRLEYQQEYSCLDTLRQAVLELLAERG